MNRRQSLFTMAASILGGSLTANSEAAPPSELISITQNYNSDHIQKWKRSDTGWKGWFKYEPIMSESVLIICPDELIPYRTLNPCKKWLVTFYSDDGKVRQLPPLIGGYDGPAINLGTGEVRHLHIEDTTVF